MRHAYPKLFFAPLFLVLIPVSTFAGLSDFTVQVPDRKIAQFYVALLDKDIETAASHLDSNGWLPASWPKNASGTESNPLSMYTTQDSLQQSAELAEAFAHAYTIPSSKWHDKPEIKNQIQTFFQNVLQKNASDHPFVFSGQMLDSRLLASLLEPLINAYALMASSFDESQQKQFRAFFDRELEALYQHPLHQQNENGMLWCALMAQAAQFTGKSTYRQAAEPMIPWMLECIAPSGEYLDPAGFDLHRALIFIRSFFLYRLYAGDETLDEPLIRCLRWYTQLFSYRGIPLLGIHTPQDTQHGELTAQILGPLCYYANREPLFAQTATQFVQFFLDSPAGFTLKFGGYTFLLAAQYHQMPNSTPSATLKKSSIVQYRNNSQSQYVIIKRNYETAVMLDDPIHAKGMQVWSYKDQPPILFPYPPRFSRFVGFGYDSRRLNVHQEKQSASCTIQSPTDGIDVLMVPYDDPAMCFIFTNDMTVTIYRQPYEDAILEWMQHSPVCSAIDSIQGNSLLFSGTSARMLLPLDTVPNYEELTEGTRLRLRFKSDFCWCTLAGPKSGSIVRPLQYGLIFVHLTEGNRTVNLLLNLSPDPFSIAMDFPGTTIPIPSVKPWSASLILSQ